MNVHSKISRVTAYMAIVAGASLGVYGIVSKILQNHNSGTPNSQTWADIQMPIFLTLLSGILLYVLKTVEQVDTKLESLESTFKIKAPVLFQNQNEFFDELLRRSIKAKSIYTHMLSIPPEILGDGANKYFTTIHKEVKKKKFDSFYRIATIHSAAKAKWILDTVLELEQTDSFSIAIQYVDGDYPQTSFHVALENSESILFVWVTMTSGGIGKGFLLEDSKVAELMKDEYEREFHDSIPLKKGRQLYWNNLRQLAEKYELKENEKYKQFFDSEPHKNKL